MKAEDFWMEAREDIAKSYYLPLHPTYFQEFAGDQARRIEGIDRVPHPFPLGNFASGLGGITGQGATLDTREIRVT